MLSKALQSARAQTAALLKTESRFFRTSQALGNKFNVFIDGKPVSVSLLPSIL
jgi:hypothetical protein